MVKMCLWPQQIHQSVFFLIQSWLSSCLACPSRDCVLCLGDLTPLLCSTFLCVYAPKSCVTSMSYLISVSCVSQCDLICQHQTVQYREIPPKTKNGNDGFSFFPSLNARSLTTLLPTVCLYLPHWTEVFEPLINWILSSRTGSTCVGSRYFKNKIKSLQKLGENVLLWLIGISLVDIQDFVHAIKVKLHLV